MGKRRLDIGSGKEVTHEKCPRSKLQHQCIQYLGPVGLPNTISMDFSRFQGMISSIYMKTHENYRSRHGLDWVVI